MEYYIGISMSTASTVETGVAIMDSFGKIILVDKLYSMKDIQFFLDNFSSLKQSHICVSLPWDNSMLEGKWRIQSKPYQMVLSNEHILNRNNWTQRYATRGCEYYRSLKESGIDISRFELYITRQELKLSSYFKERTPADCKFLQNALKIEYQIEDIPPNMMPMAQLEAIVGALIIKEKTENPKNIKKLFEFSGLDVINVIQNNVTNL
ncbi:MAG: hypothetical protein ACI4SM_01990 [Candidatus Gastranaerophilaceae bacterium]